MNQNVDIQSPMFQPRPGWGGQLSAWSKANRRSLTIIASLAVALVAGTLIFRGGTPDFSQATPTPFTSTIKVTAQQGDSVTTLARRALQMYLLNRAGTISLTDIQELYVETLLKNEMGEGRLSVGQELAFPLAIIESAIEASKAMTDYQIRYYSQFVN